MTQDEALEILKFGHNVFLTGPAGSGKTYLMNRYVEYLEESGVPVAITASTGIAATHLGGQTIHSWSGIGIRDYVEDGEIEELAEKDRIKRNWRSARVLVIDEISMLHAHQLDLVDRLGRAVLDPDKPFGGVQVILSGDFFQLPPVSVGWGREEVRFAYEGTAWESGGFQVCYLSEQFRQDDEDALTAVLNDIRNGTAGEHTREPLRECYKREPKGAVRPTRLFARNVNVDAVNEKALMELPGHAKIFRMRTHGFKAMADSLKRSCLAPELLKLKIGAEVMFVKNAQDGSYVNGTRGVVESFDEHGLPCVRTMNGELIVAEEEEWRLDENGTVRATLTQIPLRLAWAITIHKSQGMTLDCAEMDLSDAFTPGMGYVALSRVRSLAGLKLLGLNDVALSVHPKVLLHDQKFKEWSNEVRDAVCAFSEAEKKEACERVLRERFGVSPSAGKKVKQKKAPAGKKEKKLATHEVTRALLEEGRSLEEISKERGITVGTILGHMEKLQGLRRLPDISYMRDSIDDFDAIHAEFQKSDTGALAPVFNHFNGTHSFETLKLVRLFSSA